MSEFNEKGGEVHRQDVDRFMELLDRQLEKTSILVASGSVPPGVPFDIYEKMIQKAGREGVKTILDDTGELLTNGIKAKPFLIKPNEEELGTAYNRKPDSLEDIIEMAQKAVEDGVSYVCVSRGSKGAVFVTEKHVYMAEPVKVDIRGIQGAGDSMVAGFCYAI